MPVVALTYNVAWPERYFNVAWLEICLYCLRGRPGSCAVFFRWKNAVVSVSRHRLLCFEHSKIKFERFSPFANILGSRRLL